MTCWNSERFTVPSLSMSDSSRILKKKKKKRVKYKFFKASTTARLNNTLIKLTLPMSCLISSGVSLVSSVSPVRQLTSCSKSLWSRVPSSSKSENKNEFYQLDLCKNKCWCRFNTSLYQIYGRHSGIWFPWWRSHWRHSEDPKNLQMKGFHLYFQRWRRHGRFFSWMGWTVTRTNANIMTGHPSEEHLLHNSCTNLHLTLHYLEFWESKDPLYGYSDIGDAFFIFGEKFKESFVSTMWK